MAGRTHCWACGAKTNELAEICVKCGVRLTEAPKAARAAKAVSGDISPKSRLVATLLAWFLGIFGAHRFYVGKIGSAIGMLILSIIYFVSLFFTGIGWWGVGIFGSVCIAAVGIWAFVDFLIAVTGNMRDSEGRLIKDWGV
jgi:TM2 domain-containing membrane protein YozV